MIIVNRKNFIPQDFPNGERKFYIGKGFNSYLNCNPERNFVIMKYENDLDLITLMMVKKYIDEKYPFSENILKLGYIPYSRMDRTNGENIFSLKYVCKLINDLLFDSVEIVEPHSDVAPALLNNVIEYNMMKHLLNKVEDDLGSNIDKNNICYYFPDFTAQKRQLDKINPTHYLTGIKHRDFTTGRITSLEVVGQCEDLGNKTVVMVDDLCSFGGTFVLGAKKLKEIGATKIILVVPHCETNITKGEVFTSGLIDKVYTSDTILRRTGDVDDLVRDGKLIISNYF